jgi:glycosyltransferase involved in cell wall biosynthesis
MTDNDHFQGRGGHRDILMDVSRLIWRTWRGGLPTGIDRVCLAYLKHYRARSLAVIQRRGIQLVLSPAQSDRLFEILLSGQSKRRGALLRSMITAVAGLRRSPPRRGMIYLNVGHTGLNELSLPGWVAAQGVRAVYMIHDLIPVIHPHYCRPAEEAKHRERLNNMLASATGIIGNSKTSLAELADYASANGLQTPPTVAAWISGPELPDEVALSSSERPYFVTVGTIEGRKNHQLLLEIWRSLVAKMGGEAPLLVIIGQRGWQADEVFRTLDRPGELGAHILELGECGDDQLAGWIAGARALLMPSFAEGFGLPVVEALQLGTPVIASDLPVFKEIAGTIPAFQDPSDHEGWYGIIRHYLSDGLDRRRQLEQIRRYRPPTWADHFAVVDGWLTSLPPLRTARPA